MQLGGRLGGQNASSGYAAHRRRELGIEKGLKADILHMSDQLGSRTEGGLFKEAYGISLEGCASTRCIPMTAKTTNSWKDRKSIWPTWNIWISMVTPPLLCRWILGRKVNSES